MEAIRPSSLTDLPEEMLTYIFEFCTNRNVYRELCHRTNGIVLHDYKKNGDRYSLHLDIVLQTRQPYPHHYPTLWQHPLFPYQKTIQIYCYEGKLFRMMDPNLEAFPILLRRLKGFIQSIPKEFCILREMNMEPFFLSFRCCSSESSPFSDKDLSLHFEDLPVVFQSPRKLYFLRQTILSAFRKRLCYIK